MSTFGGTINATGTTVKYDVDFTLSSEGVVNVLYNVETDKKIKLIIQNGVEKYIYDLSTNDEYESFPLQLGDGQYKVMIYENVEGTSYKSVYSETSYVTIENELSVYTQSIQQVKWNEENEAIILANALVEEALIEKVSDLGVTGDEVDTITLTDEEVINVIYTYVVQNMTYDYNKISGLSYNYIPEIDTVLADTSGICYDYSVLLAAMLRSQDIPTKLIKGYASFTTVYHAWNEIYLESEERWIVVDTTYDAFMYQNNYSYSLEKSADDYSMSKEF
jgi:hypothetical protein